MEPNSTIPPQSETIGFPRSPASAPVAPPAGMTKPTPLPHRPKGRWFIGFLLFAGLSFGGWHLHETFFRYRAFGVVEGRLMRIPAPWDGEVASFHVREGEAVRQGQVLLTMDSVALRQKLERLGDELVLAQADLDAESAKLKLQTALRVDQTKWQAANSLDHAMNAATRNGEMRGQYLQEKKTLERLQIELTFKSKLFSEKIVPWLEVDRLKYEVKGKTERLVKIEEGLNESEKLAEEGRVLIANLTGLSESFRRDTADQIKPHFARINSIKAERSRLETLLIRGRLVAPSNGLVVRIHRFAGEFGRAGETMISFLEEGSLQIVLYVPQQTIEQIAPGATLQMIVDPYPERIEGKVSRRGDEFDAAPEQIKRHYFAGQRLLPIYVTPAAESARWMALRLNGVVKLP